MHCHDIGFGVEIPDGAKKIVLAGNPNVGKSVFFNALTGLYVDVSNYPGTTLEISHGSYGNDVVIDTPGVYGISSFNDEERIARDIILSADMVVNIVDAVHLERDLFLTQQIIDTGVPVIIALNMIDEAEKQGININCDLLGVPVYKTIATDKVGIEELKTNLSTARKGNIDYKLEEMLNDMTPKVGTFGEALLVLEGDEIVAKRHGIPPEEHRDFIYKLRRERVNDIVGHVVSEINTNAQFTVKLGRWMIRPITGIPILLMALYFLYWVVGIFIAGDVVGITEETIMQGIYEPAIRGFVGQYIAPSSVLGTILIGEFGVLTMTVTYIFGLLLPLVLGFYLVLSLFEDSGYLPRIATLVDRVLSFIGLNGRAVIPIILGFGCVTMATIVTRVLGSDRERRIATFLLALAIPCSAQLGVVLGLLGRLGPEYIGLYVFAIFSMLVAVGTILNRFLPGESTDLMIDLPPIRLPRLENVLKKTGVKSYHFIKEAGPLFAIGAFIISMLQITGMLEILQDLAAPITVGLLKLPREAATAFIMGFVRRDFGAAGFSEMELTAMQTVVGLTTITMFVPCIASALVIFKERGMKEGFIIWPSVFVIAFVIGGLVANVFAVFKAILPVYGLFAIIVGLSIIMGSSKKPESFGGESIELK